VSEDSFLVLSNYKAPNFKILKSISKLNASIVNMETLVEHDENVFINNLILVDNFLVLEIREKGLPELSIYNLTTKKRKNIIFNDNAYDVSFAYNKELNGSNFYYSYSSLTTPPSIINYDLIKSESKVLWEKELVGFDKSNYKDQRFFINARDGIEVPVITIAHSSTDLNNAPILFYGYGSYGINIDASFRSSLIPLLDKGFVFSIINIRGGGEMGKHWYEDGRMLNKLNTFNDFNDGVKEVLKKGIGDPNNVFARGGSAGGLLMGGIINMEPGLYKGILSGVPFVDVLTTMSDASIPLTTFEYDEWGNPAIEKEYFYIKQYSPYDNIDKRNYPAVLVTSSLYDSQVQYFEPAKYIAKLREYNQSDNPILMKMNLIGGHGGMSGRINQFKEISEEYNFILNLVD
jgi:oligopeptidase B